MTEQVGRLSLRRLSGRAVPIADQLVWSASNVLTVIAAARLLSASEFGTLSAALLIVLMAVATSRAFVTEPLLLRGHGDELSDTPESSVSRAVIGGACVLGVLLSTMAVVGLGLFDWGVPASVLAVLFAACWFNLVQDSVRFVAVALRRPAIALVCDAGWLVCSMAFFSLSFVGIDGSVEIVLLVWAIGAATGAVVGMVGLRSGPRIGVAVEWLRSNRHFGARLAADALAGVIAATLSFLLLGAIAGPEALAGLRGAYLLLGPMNAVTEGAYLAFVPAFAARTRAGHGIRSEVVRLGAYLTVAWVGYSALLMVVPEKWMEAVLGDTWSVADPLLPRVLAASVLGASAIALTYGVRAWRDARSLVRVRLLVLPLYLIVLPLASWWNGAIGYASMLIVVVGAQIIFYGWVFRRLESARQTELRREPHPC